MVGDCPAHYHSHPPYISEELVSMVAGLGVVSLVKNLPNFRRTSQYGSTIHPSRNRTPLSDFRRTSQYGSCSCCQNILLLHCRFQKNQLVWQLYCVERIDNVDLHFRRTSQYGSLTAVAEINPPYFRRTSQYGSLRREAEEPLQFFVFQKNQLVWQFKRGLLDLSQGHHFRRTSQYGSHKNAQSMHAHNGNFRRTSQYGRQRTPATLFCSLMEAFQKNQLVWQSNSVGEVIYSIGKFQKNQLVWQSKESESMYWVRELAASSKSNDLL